MNLKNLTSLTVRQVDFNLVAKRPLLLEKLRNLTIHSASGMNSSLNVLLERVHYKKVNCQLLLAYDDSYLVGWAMISKEDFYFRFSRSHMSFDPKDGYLFQVFVEPKYRNQGIATMLFSKTKKIIGQETMCVAPWDLKSDALFNKFDKGSLKFL